jgi:hypothetical protein
MSEVQSRPASCSARGFRAGARRVSAQLGIGSRVMTGWTAEEKSDRDACLKKGTIVSGPFDPGCVFSARGQLWRCAKRTWGVDLDGLGEVYVAEHMLLPLDDGDDQERDVEEVLEELA